MRWLAAAAVIVVLGVGTGLALASGSGREVRGHAQSPARVLTRLVSRVPRRALPAPTVPQAGGTTCFVAGRNGSCSLHPCVEFVAASSCATQPEAQAARARPLSVPVPATPRPAVAAP